MSGVVLFGEKQVRRVWNDREQKWYFSVQDVVEIRSKRGAETEYAFLARDTEAPYVDTRANLTPAPETRYYVAQFLRRDTLVGQLSDVLVVTVPGAA